MLFEKKKLWYTYMYIVYQYASRPVLPTLISGCQILVNTYKGNNWQLGCYVHFKIVLLLTKSLIVMLKIVDMIYFVSPHVKHR